MKVCVISLSPLISAGRGARVVSALKERGYEAVKLDGLADGLLTRIESRAISHAARVMPIKLERQMIPGFNRLVAKAVKCAADVYHSIDLPALAVGAAAAARRGVTVVYDVYEFKPDEVPNRDQEKRQRVLELERRHIGAARQTLAVTNTLADALAEFYSIPRPQVVRNLPARSEVGRKSKGNVSVLYQGGAAPGRGLETLLEAASRLTGDVEVVLRLIGDAAYIKHIRANAPHNVLVAEPVPPEHAIHAMVGHDIGVIPTLPVTRGNLYALPLRLGEFMMAGLAVVASDLPEIRRIVSDARCGILVPPGDAAAVAEAINHLTRSRGELDDMKRRARQAAVEKYCWEMEKERLFEVYDGFHAGGLS